MTGTRIVLNDALKFKQRSTIYFMLCAKQINQGYRLQKHYLETLNLGFHPVKPSLSDHCVQNNINIILTNSSYNFNTVSI